MARIIQALVLMTVLAACNGGSGDHPSDPESIGDPPPDPESVGDPPPDPESVGDPPSDPESIGAHPSDPESIGGSSTDPESLDKITCRAHWNPPDDRDSPNTRNDDDAEPSTDPAVLLANTPPNANAGNSIDVAPGQVVTLNGSASDDNETAALKYAWQQISGPRVALSDATVARPTFTVPSLVTQDATLTFRLTVIDEVGGIDRGTTRLNVTASRAPLREGGRISHILRGHEHIPDYLNHDGEVTDPLISADGRFVLGRGVHDPTVRVWDADTGELMHVLGHEDLVEKAILSTDGRIVLTKSVTSFFSAARLWSTATGELLYDWKMAAPGEEDDFAVVDVALSANGHIALTGSSLESVGSWLWDTATGERLRVLESDYHHGTSYVALSADARRALTWSGGEMRFWDVATGTELRRLPGDTYMLSADGSLAMSERADGLSLQIVDTATGNELCVLHGDGSIFEQTLLSANGRTVLAGSRDGTVQFWDVASCGEPRVLGQHQGSIHAMALSDDGDKVLTAGEDGTARLWSTETSSEMHVLRGHEGTVHGATLSANERFVVTTGEDKTVRLWSAETGEQIRVLDNDHGGATVESVALSADGRLAFTGGGELTARLWETDTGEQLDISGNYAGADLSRIYTVQVALSADGSRGLTGNNRYTPDGGYSRIHLWNIPSSESDYLFGYSNFWSMALNASGTMALLGNDDGRVRLADTSTNDLLRCFNGDYFVPVMDVAFGAEGRLALMGSANGKVRLWNVENGELLHELPAHETQLSSVALSADGRFALSGGGRDQIARLWSAETGKELRALAHASSVTDVALSADGSIALTADANGNSWLWDWDAPEGKQLYALRGHEKYITSVALNADGSIALTGSRDGTARVWEITVGK